MERLAITILFFVSIDPSLFGQSNKDDGKPIAEIFTDFHFNINDTSKTTGFGLNRAYLGYNFPPKRDIFATVIINIGNPEALAIGSSNRRYAYFREASISYMKDKIAVSFGFTGTRIFNFQQIFWGKRYLAEPRLVINNYGFIADVGIVLDYSINEIFKVDFTIMNGEGLSAVQLDNTVKTSLGLTVVPIQNLFIRVYGDIDRPQGILQCTFVGFAGFKTRQIKFGAEASFKSNLDMIIGHNAWGISSTAMWDLYEKTELFIRYDYSTSVIAEGDNLRWNYLKDESFIMAGVQYTFSDYVKIALNYKGKSLNCIDSQREDAVYMNALFKF